MLRASLVALGYEIAGSRPDDRLLPVQAAIEVLHSGLLIHDDIVDRADMRRHRPAINVQWRSLHAASEYVGDGEHYGNAMAMLIGDLAMFIAVDMILKSDFCAERKATAVTILTECLIFAGIGEILDFELSFRPNVSRNEIEVMTLYKTAYYTFVAPLEMGAVLAGVTDRTKRIVEAFGIPLGVAYQRRDELEGVFGNAEEIGKPVMSDLREGKKNSLFSYGLEMAASEDRAHLATSLGNAEASYDDLTRVRRALTECGARQRALDKLNEDVCWAKGMIGSLTDEACLKQNLLDLCAFVSDSG